MVHAEQGEREETWQAGVERRSAQPPRLGIWERVGDVEGGTSLTFPSAELDFDELRAAVWRPVRGRESVP
jgi:hypothetical protein